MTCHKIFNGCIVCVNPWGRLHVGKHYVWVDFHPYCGPNFWWDRAMEYEYSPKGIRDPIWKEFGKWLKKYDEKKEKISSNKN